MVTEQSAPTCPRCHLWDRRYQGARLVTLSDLRRFLFQSDRRFVQAIFSEGTLDGNNSSTSANALKGAEDDVHYASTRLDNPLETSLRALVRETTPQLCTLEHVSER